MSTTETPAETLARIQSTVSKNDFAAIVQFANCGIHPNDITPRVNVLTFKAWKALGRRVAKGATGQRVTVWVPVEKAGKPDGVRPITAILFHESQTIAEDAEKGTRPAAWTNAQLVKEGTYDAAQEPTAETDAHAETLAVISHAEYKAEEESFTPEIVTISSQEAWTDYLTTLAPEPVADIPTQAERAAIQYAGWNRPAAPAPQAARKQLAMF